MKRRKKSFFSRFFEQPVKTHFSACAESSDDHFRLVWFVWICPNLTKWITVYTKRPAEVLPGAFASDGRIKT